MKTHSPDYYIRLARKNGLKVEEGGNHTKIHGPAGRGYMALPRHTDLSRGVECNVKKWFRLLGILVAILSAVALAL